MMMEDNNPPSEGGGAEAAKAEPEAAPGPRPEAPFMRWETIKPRPGLSFYADFHVLEELGQGAYGKAFKAQRLADGDIVVAKQITTESMSMREKLETKQEVKVLAHMDHPNVVKYYSAYAEEREMIIVMEYCEEGDLTKFLKMRKGRLLEEHQIMLRFVQVCLALHHVHEQGILHRDLKSSNIFCDTFSIVKLGDFGISKMMGAESQCHTIVGTPYYLSPEICEDKPYGVKSDMWSLGCVLYELCTLKHAFDGKSLPQLVLKILNGKFPPIAKHYSEDLKSLVNSLLARNPNDRPSLSDIFKMGYVREHLHRYVIHIQKHITKRKDSFKRSVARWDPNGFTEHADRSGMSPFSNVLGSTIAKRQNSGMPLMEDSLLSSATPPRPGTAPGQTGAGAKKLRAMSPDLFGTGKPPPRPQTAGGRKVSISDVVEEQDFDKSIHRRKIDLIDTETSSDDGGGGLDLNQAHGMSLLKLGLPPSRFDGDPNADQGEDAEAEPIGGGEGVQDLLPASRWSVSGASSRNDRDAQHGADSQMSSFSALDQEAPSLFQRSGGSTRSVEDRKTRSNAGSASSHVTEERPGSADENREVSAEKEAAIRRLMSAGASLGSASTLAEMASAMEGSLRSHTESDLSVPGKSVDGVSRQASSRQASSYSSPMMSNDAIYMRLDSQATSNGDVEEGSGRGASDPRHSSQESSSASAAAGAGAGATQLVAPPKPLPPLKLAPRDSIGSGSFALRAERANSSTVVTPQFRMAPPPAAPPGAPVGSLPESASAPPPAQSMGSLDHWHQELAPLPVPAAGLSPTRAQPLLSAEPSLTAPALGSSFSIATEHALSRFAPSQHRSPEQSSVDSPSPASPLSPLGQAPPAAAEDAPAADAASLPAAVTATAHLRQPGDLSSGSSVDRAATGRTAAARAKDKYAEVKAEQEAAAAARARSHREQLLAAKEAKEKAKVAAQTQAALWVKMLKQRVQNAKARVPGGGAGGGEGAHPHDDAGEPPGSDEEVVATASPQAETDPAADHPAAEEAGDGDIPERLANGATGSSLPSTGTFTVSTISTESASFFEDLAWAGKQTFAISRASGLLDQVHELLEEPTPPRMLPAPSLRVMVDGDILALQGRIQQLHDEAKALLGTEVFMRARQYIWESMNEDAAGEADEGRDTQAALLGIVGAAGMAHLPLVLKTVKQELVYAEVVGGQPAVVG